jgi:hypothetical protein
MKKEEIKFNYELCTEEEVRNHIRNCEGKHVQQVIFSTYMDTLTQVCFTCGKVRSSIKWDGNRSWKLTP